MYRELLRISKPLTLDGRGHAELRGSDVWTSWTRNGGVWVSEQAVPRLTTNVNTVCLPNTSNACQHAEQVFVDGEALSWVPGNPSSGQFGLTAGRQVLLADDPTGHTVEVTTRQQWVDVQADNVTIKGFTMREVGSAANVSAGISNHGHNGFTIQDSVLSDAAGTIVSLDGGSNGQVLRNDISRAGQLGIGAWEAERSVVKGNKIHDNAIGQYDWTWAAGGLKFSATTDTTVDHNDVWSNQGPGIWFDIGSKSTIISDNRIHNNPINPIEYEVSDGASIFGNSIWDSAGWGAIVSSSSGNVDVHDNTIAHTPSIFVELEDRPDRGPTAGINDRVHDNVLVSPTENQPNRWWQVSTLADGNLDKNNVLLIAAPNVPEDVSDSSIDTGLRGWWRSLVAGAATLVQRIVQ
jgi:hypothetical protein